MTTLISFARTTAFGLGRKASLRSFSNAVIPAKGVGGISDRMRSAAETASACLRECALQGGTQTRTLRITLALMRCERSAPSPASRERVGVRAVVKQSNLTAKRIFERKRVLFSRDGVWHGGGRGLSSSVGAPVDRPHPNPGATLRPRAPARCGRGSKT
jgi:hypothetical protein